MNKTAESENKVETYDFGGDFKILSANEKREVLKIAKTYLRLLKDNALLAGASFPKDEDEKKA